MARQRGRSQHEKFDKKLAQEEAWLRQGIKARRTRDEGRVRALMAMRKERAARRGQIGQVRLQAELGRTLGPDGVRSRRASANHSADRADRAATRRSA